jgi:hypothetical protein
VRVEQHARIALEYGSGVEVARGRPPLGVRMGSPYQSWMNSKIELLILLEEARPRARRALGLAHLGVNCEP